MSSIFSQRSKQCEGASSSCRARILAGLAGLGLPEAPLQNLGWKEGTGELREPWPQLPRAVREPRPSPCPHTPARPLRPPPRAQSPAGVSAVSPETSAKRQRKTQARRSRPRRDQKPLKSGPVVPSTDKSNLF